MEAIGDTTASAEVSRIHVEGEDFDSRIQGGLLVRPTTEMITDDILTKSQSDGIGGFISALLTVTPASTFAQV